MSSVFQVRRGSWTMRLPGIALQERRRQQTDDVIALDEAALLVEQEAAVVVAVPADRAVGTVLAQRLDRRPWFSTSIGFGTPFGNMPSGSCCTLMNLNGRYGSSLSTMSPAPPLPACTTTLSGLQLRTIDVRQQVLDVLGHDVDGEALADARGLREPARLRELPDVLTRPGVAADRTRALAHELHAVVVGRVVARRHHDAAVHLARERREVDDLRAAEADVVDVDAGIEQALLQRLAEQFAREADVPTDDDPLRLDELGIGAPDAVRDVLVEFVGMRPRRS